MNIAFVIPFALILVIFLFFMFPEVIVDGDSMYPTYSDGEILRGSRFFLKKNLKIGEVIVYKTPVKGDSKTVIKRINKVSVLGVYCLGDNSDVSFDSRYYGFVPYKNVVCKVIQQRERVKL